jgi:uncharacterized membrane protein HdeD (DUF308 family)
MSDQTVNQMTTTVVSSLKRASGWWLVRAAVSIIIGVLVLVWPQSTVNVIVFLAGLAFVILGVLRVVEGIVSKDSSAASKTANIILGALVLILGVVVMRNPGITAVVVFVIVGISWILEGIATVAGAATGEGNWVTVVLGLLVAVAGVIVVIFADGAVIAYAWLIGLTLIAVGIIGVITFFVARSALKRA